MLNVVKHLYRADWDYYTTGVVEMLHCVQHDVLYSQAVCCQAVK